MTSGYSYSTYTNWDLWIPIGVSVLTILLTTLAVAASLIWFKFHRSTAHHCLELAYHFSRLVLGDSLRRDLEAHPPRLTLFDRQVSPVTMILLSTLSPILFIPAFVSFWASFLVDETFACDPGLDCFSRDPSSFAINHQRLPLFNCTDFDTTSTTVICFQFVLDYTTGFAAMAGLLVVDVISLRVYGIILMWLVGIMPSSAQGEGGKCGSCRVLCSVVGIFIFFLAPIIISVIILLIVLLVSFVNEIVFQSSERTLKFATYWTSFLVSGTVTGAGILVTVLGNRLHQESYDTTTSVEHEAEITSSFIMSATNPLQQEPGRSVNATMTSLSVAVKTEAQPVPSKYEEPDFNPPKLVGSVLNSYRDVTSLSPQHTESSLLLSAPSRTSDYQTT